MSLKRRFKKITDKPKQNGLMQRERLYGAKLAPHFIKK
jgi:hypothetical protein